MSFLDDLNAAKSAPAPHDDIDVLINGHVHVLRFYRLDGYEWSCEVDRHPMRPGVRIDMTYGFNFRALTKAVAPRCAFRVVGDDEVPLSAEEWEALFAPKVLTGRYFGAMTDALFRLNIVQPQQELDAAKKELASSAPSSD
jgi:hypothetical protein